MMQRMVSDPRKNYIKQGILTASPAELIVMLYEGCVKNLKLAAIVFNDKKDIEATNNHLIKAQEIINELVNSLDLSIEISHNLLKLYDFMLAEIRAVNVSKEMEKLDPVIEMLESMRDTWREVEQQNKGSALLENEV